MKIGVILLCLSPVVGFSPFADARGGRTVAARREVASEPRFDVTVACFAIIEKLRGDERNIKSALPKWREN